MDEKKINNLKSWLINNALSIITLIGPTVAISVKKVYLSGTKWTLLEVLMFSLLVLEFTVVLIKGLWEKFSCKSYRYPSSKIQSNHSVIWKKTTYTMTDNDELHFSRSLMIKAESYHVRYIFDKYIWTGSHIAKTPTPVTHIRQIDQESLIGIWNYFRIALAHPLAKGEVLELEYKWPVIKNCRDSSPFVSTSTEEPTKKVSFVINLGVRYANREIMLEEYRAIESDDPLSVETAVLDERGCYTWDIVKPKRFRYYRVRWSWDENPNHPTM